MAITFGTSVAINNVLALRAFYTFLFNYELHDHPTFIERFFLPCLKSWTAEKGWMNMCELMRDPAARTASVTLNDVSSGFFAILYLVANPHELGSMSTGKELFLLIAQMELDFEKIRKPRESIQHG